MSRRPATPPRTRRRPAAPRRRRVLVVAVLIGIVVMAFWAMARESPRRLAARAEAEAVEGDWAAALADWRAVNRTDAADGRSWLGEARACLALGRAGQAERALERAAEVAPGDPEPWLIRLELIRLEDRPLDALRVGWSAYQAVGPPARREVLRALTLALLADPPAELARATLDRWIEADPADLDARVARVALDRRLDPHPRAGATTPEARAATLAGLLGRDPSHLAAREALVRTWLDLAEPARARVLLDAWPRAGRDARYHRLLGRLAQDFDHQPAEAAASYRRAMAELPHDWKTLYRLARTLQTLGQPAEARHAADRVARLREALAPEPLGRLLNTNLAHLDDPDSQQSLADLCDRIGLVRLADAWRLAAAEPSVTRPESILGPGPRPGPPGRSWP